MHDKFAVITGASSGLGALLAESLVRDGWRLALLNRSFARSRAVLERLAAIDAAAQVQVVEVDLADRDALVRATEVLLARYPRIDALFNNAGVMLGDLRYSKHGHEMHFQVNTLAPYVLTRMLAEPLAVADGVVLNVSSGMIERTGRLDVSALPHPPRMRKLVGPYAQSKLALTAMTNAMALEYGFERVRLRSMTPGANRTAMTAGDGMPRALRWLQPLLFKSPEIGARQMRDAAFDPKFGARTGLYIDKDRVAKPPKDADDPRAQAELIALCRECTGV
ncbi:MAG: SDR family NAD(P)-dependent oxidoreductase [Lysobacter sp.]|nr:MAG: SDR family NAD(P)-dependent oxidoreductase [Lysobacter sp.]